MERLVITTIGRDRPGIVAGISKVLSQHNANILKTRASALGELFVMVMLADVSCVDVSVNELTSKLKDRGVELGSGVSVEDASEYRKKRLVAFDLDGTLINMEIINELAKIVGVENEVNKLTQMAMQGKMDFEEALTKRVSLLKGIPTVEVENLKKRIPITPGAHDLVAELKKAGFITAIITGSFSVFAEHVAEKLGIDYVYANKLLSRDGKLTGEFEGKVLSPESKLVFLVEISRKENVNLAQCIAVGDGANDILILKKSGLGIAYKPKRVVKPHAKAIVNIKDLKTLLAVIGLTSGGNDVAKRIPT